MLATILRLVLALGTGFTSTELLVLQAAVAEGERTIPTAPSSHCHPVPDTEHSAP